LQDDLARLLLTLAFRDFIGSFHWERPNPYPLLHDVHRLLNQLWLQPARVVEVDTTGVKGYRSHPIPLGCEGCGLIEFWSDEMGRLLVLHDACCDGGRFFAGVACAYAFAGDELGQYCNPEQARAFPLVGPDDLQRLDDAYVWVVPNDIHQRQVGFREACRHASVLGAIGIDEPSGGSHYKVRFPRARSWTLDANVDPLPDRFLKELEPITGFPLQVIKTALTTGRLPRQVLRFTR